MFTNAQRTIREEILTSNANHLNQFVNILDMKFDNMVEKNSQILASGAIRKQISYSSSNSNNSTGYEIYETKKYLGGFPQDDFSDVFVYFRKKDRIISAEKSSVTSRDYYNTYYRLSNGNFKNSDEKYDTFLEAITPNTLVPRLVSLGQDKTTLFLGVVLSMNYTNLKKECDASSVLILKPELIKNLIQNAMYKNEGSILIYDNNNTLLLSSGPDDVKLDLNKYKGNSNNIYQDTINGKEYVLHYFPSKVLNCTYVSLISSDTFWEKLNGMRAISTVSIILSMLVSVILSWLLARRSYSPIDSIVHTIHNKSDFPYDFKNKNELDFIKDVIVNTFLENDMLSSRIKNSKNNLFEDFMLHAMQGTLANNKYLVQESDQIKLNFLSESFSILLVNIDTVNEEVLSPIQSNNGQLILSFLVENIMSELCAKSHRGFVINLQPKVFAVVLNYASNFTQAKKQEDTLEIGHSFQNFINQHFNIQSTISFSCPVDGFMNLNLAYKQAFQAMEYRYLLGKGSMIPFQDVTNKRFTYNNSFNSKNSLILIQYVKENTESDINEIIQGIISNSMIDRYSSLNVIECFKYDLINTINKIIFEIGAVEYEKQHNFVHDLIYAETFLDFQEDLKTTLISLKKFKEENNEQFTICDEAEELIHKCYMDINLNNSIIADKLDISPSYLSKLFRNQKNISLLDYLYQVRLSYAKNFLRETNLTIEEIAAKTGFISDSALIKSFKKYEGITPGAYRKLVLSLSE
jgi:AraC-like DNA-binding protein